MYTSDNKAQTAYFRYVLLGTGYYDYDRGYTPDLPGLKNFKVVLFILNSGQRVP